MKRTFVLFLALLAGLVSSCMKGDYVNDSDFLGGTDSVDNRQARTYMMSLADDLVADVLEEVELALTLEERGAQTSFHFDMGGKFTSVGASWTVKAADSKFKDMTLQCVGPQQWKMSFQGELFLVYEDNVFPTRFTLNASRYTATEADTPAEGWVLTLSGEREERKGYRCTFETSSLTCLNTRGAGAAGWNQILGDLYMKVFKDNQEVDLCCLSFEGSPSQATFQRGL